MGIITTLNATNYSHTKWLWVTLSYHPAAMTKTGPFIGMPPSRRPWDGAMDPAAHIYLGPPLLPTSQPSIADPHKIPAKNHSSGLNKHELSSRLPNKSLRLNTILRRHVFETSKKELDINLAKKSKERLQFPKQIKK